ncbi:MAG TPA: HD domain-containing protein [Thermoanaerobacterales bacterium]|jgi:HD-GYP domain-containing protein (c-di-GMP phosphodiesterase class II)|nr:HD domain-containing protein [Thermoanaerobacterales bacterium]
MDSNAQFFSELVTALSLMMDLDENRKLYHAWRVAILSERLARKILPEYRADIFYAGLLHDIGAISLPDHVIHYTDINDHLNNPVLFNHTRKGAIIVNEIGPLSLSARMILDHHEHWDGSGYPRGKKGHKIDIGGQILNICDTFDILIRQETHANFKQVRAALDMRRNKIYSNLMYELLIATLEEDDFFNKIIFDERVSDMMLKTIKELPKMNMAKYNFDIHRVARVFATVIDAKHSYTAGHSERVANYTYKLATALDLPEERADNIKVAAYLHDAGKVAIPKSILDKPGKLTQQESTLMKKHPEYTMEIMSMVSALKSLVVVAGGHHERYDGSGYPDGNFGDNIPIGARIMAIADAFDAMTSVRPYQKRKNADEAKKELKKNSGSQFDPHIVKVALKVLP